MVTEATWEEFRAAGLLWWINRALHLFGWAIVFEFREDGALSRVYPARCRFRGFAPEAETQGFRDLTLHVEAEMPRLLDESAP